MSDRTNPLQTRDDQENVDICKDKIMNSLDQIHELKIDIIIFKVHFAKYVNGFGSRIKETQLMMIISQFH